MEQAIRSTEHIGDTTVCWMVGVGEGVEESVRDLLSLYTTFMPKLLVVGFSPDGIQDTVFAPGKVGGEDGNILLSIGDRWWDSEAEQAEYDLVMSLVMAHLIEAGKLGFGRQGIELHDATELGIDPTTYLNSLADMVIKTVRA
jgi:hypothetical protein